MYADDCLCSAESIRTPRDRVAFIIGIIKRYDTISSNVGRFYRCLALETRRRSTTCTYIISKTIIFKKKTCTE